MNGTRRASSGLVQGRPRTNAFKSAFPCSVSRDSNQPPGRWVWVFAVLALALGLAFSIERWRSDFLLFTASLRGFTVEPLGTRMYAYPLGQAYKPQPIGRTVAPHLLPVCLRLFAALVELRFSGVHRRHSRPAFRKSVRSFFLPPWKRIHESAQCFVGTAFRSRKGHKKLKEIERTSSHVRYLCNLSWYKTHAIGSGRPSVRRFGAPVFQIGGSVASDQKVTWLILPVVICLSQRLSLACLSINNFIL